MLVLHRSYGESVTMILPNGDKIEVVLAQSWKGNARLMISAPQNVRVLRTEVLTNPNRDEVGGA